MQHLEEGTIHAWLDGALDETEAARVARHAAECESCAAMVAEARGFVAGASRIVSALDVVRGGVIPPSGSSGSPRDQLASRRRSLWTTLHLTPARAAIAATVLIAVGSMLSLRKGVGGRDLELESRAAADRSVGRIEAPAAAPAPASAAMDSVSAAATRPDMAGERREAAIANSVSAKKAKEVGPSRQALQKQPVAVTAANERAREPAPIEAAKIRANAQAAGAAAPVSSPSAPPPAVGRVAGAADVAANAPRDRRSVADTVTARLADSVARALRTAPDSTRAFARRVADPQTRSMLAAMSEAVLDAASAAEGCYSVVSPIPVWAPISREFALDRAIVADSMPQRRVVRSASGARRDGPIGGAWWRPTGGRGVEVTWPVVPNVVVLKMQLGAATIVANIGDAAHSESITLTRAACSPR
jgi:hypothetical protein